MLGVAEAFTLTAALGLLGGAALVTAGVAALGLPVPLQLLVFAVAATAGIVGAPADRRAAHAPRRTWSASGWTRCPGRPPTSSTT